MRNRFCKTYRTTMPTMLSMQHAYSFWILLPLLVPFVCVVATDTCSAELQVHNDGSTGREGQVFLIKKTWASSLSRFWVAYWGRSMHHCYSYGVLVGMSSRISLNGVGSCMQLKGKGVGRLGKLHRQGPILQQILRHAKNNNMISILYCTAVH